MVDFCGSGESGNLKSVLINYNCRWCGLSTSNRCYQYRHERNCVDSGASGHKFHKECDSDYPCIGDFIHVEDRKTGNKARIQGGSRKCMN